MMSLDVVILVELEPNLNPTHVDDLDQFLVAILRVLLIGDHMAHVVQVVEHEP
jgi:hypothetical protein